MHYPLRDAAFSGLSAHRDDVSGAAPSKANEPGAAIITLPDAVNEACLAIYKSWSKFLTEEEAREQAEQFRSRFKTIAAEGHLSEAELDATLSIIADTMGLDA